MAVLLTGANVPKVINYIDYIQTTGTQWIDTGFTPNNNSRIVLDFAASDVSKTNNIVGTRNTTSSKAFAFSVINSYWRMGYNTSSPQTSVAADTDRHTADLNKNVLSLDGTAIYTATAATFAGYSSIYIGAIHASGSYYGYVKVYSCQIYDNGTLVRDLWPCLDEAGVACMYDKVSKTYYYNAGTGEFTAG